MPPLGGQRTASASRQEEAEEAEEEEGEGEEEAEPQQLRGRVATTRCIRLYLTCIQNTYSIQVGFNSRCYKQRRKRKSIADAHASASADVADGASTACAMAPNGHG